jgi:hypothetical protein
LDGKVHLYPCTFSYWFLTIIVGASEFQSWFYRMGFCVFLNKIISNKQLQASHWRMLSPTNRTVITYCIVITIILITIFNLRLLMVQYITNYLLKNDSS